MDMHFEGTLFNSVHYEALRHKDAGPDGWKCQALKGIVPEAGSCQYHSGQQANHRVSFAGSVVRGLGPGVRFFFGAIPSFE